MAAWQSLKISLRFQGCLAGLKCIFKDPGLPGLPCRDFALSEIAGPKPAALPASLPVGQQYIEHVCTFYSRCNMKYDFRHKRYTSPHDNHCDPDDRCWFYFITSCDAGRLAFIIPACTNQSFGRSGQGLNVSLRLQGCLAGLKDAFKAPGLPGRA